MTTPTLTATCSKCGCVHRAFENTSFLLHWVNNGCKRCKGQVTVDGYKPVRVDSLSKGQRFISLGTLREYVYDHSHNGCCVVKLAEKPKTVTYFAGCATALVKVAA